MSTSTSAVLSLDERITTEWACERPVKKFAHLNDDQDHHGIAALFVEETRFSPPASS